jgi:hypothetical protein
MCANIHTLTLTFRSPYEAVGDGYDDYRRYPIDDYCKDFDLQVVLALKHLRKVTVLGVAKHKKAINGISGFDYLQGVVRLTSQLKDALRKQGSDAEVRVRLECMGEVEERVL